MKVLLVHNFYRSSSPSGEDAVFRNEVDLLRKNGQEVVLYERSNEEIPEGLRRFTAGFSAVWARKTYQELSALIAREKPDIAHFHNIWYLISPSGYHACKDAGIPVVQTLHNFRMFCANGLLLRDGEVCEECIGNVPWRSMRYGCYRNSRFFSVPVAISEMVHQARGTWSNAVNAYIALTEFGKKKFIQCGLPGDRIFVKPNFLPDIQLPPAPSTQYAVFIGRLSEEKGIDVLLKAFHILSSSHSQIPASSHSPIIPSLSLKVVGDGPLKEKIMRICGNGSMAHIELVGRKSHEECMELLKGARFLVLPSVCYENFPVTIGEAFACGKPVIASRLGAMAEIVKDNEAGLLVEPGNAEDLACAMKRLWEDEALCNEMGANARAEFEERYTAQKNFDMMMDIYQQVMGI